MMQNPKTLEDAMKRKYGVRGQSDYCDCRCAFEVLAYNNRWPNYHQCERKPGFGPGCLYCKQHAKKVEATP